MIASVSALLGDVADVRQASSRCLRCCHCPGVAVVALGRPSHQARGGHDLLFRRSHGRDLRLGQPRKVRTLALPDQGLFPYPLAASPREHTPQGRGGVKTMASGRAKGFWRRARNGLLSQDQVMAVDVQLEDHIGKIEGLVSGYLRSPQDEATRQALLAELDKLDDQTARADAYGNFRSVLVRYQVRAFSTASSPPLRSSSASSRTAFASMKPTTTGDGTTSGSCSALEPTPPITRSGRGSLARRSSHFSLARAVHLRAG